MILTSQERRVLIVLEDAERSLSAAEVRRKLDGRNHGYWVERILDMMTGDCVEAVTAGNHTRYTITAAGRRVLRQHIVARNA